MNPLCECPHAGYCQRHKLQKNQRKWEYCRGLASSADCGKTFWQAWELGRLGATQPADPQPAAQFDCQRTAVKPRTRRCRVGTRVKMLIAQKYKVTPKKSCGCNARARHMDQLGCEQCKAQFDQLVEMLLQGASEHFWIKPIVSLFRGNAKRAAEALLREAIDIECHAQ